MWFCVACLGCVVVWGVVCFFVVVVNVWCDAVIFIFELMVARLKSNQNRYYVITTAHKSPSEDEANNVVVA